MTIEVEGAQRLDATMAAAARELSDVSEAGQRSAAQLLATARMKAPRISGALAGSLTSDVGPVLVEVTSGLDYAGRTHYGWAAVGQAAQPFLTDALAELEPRITEAYMAEVEQALAKVEGT